MPNIGFDLYVGSPDKPQPDWRKGDPDDKLNDNEDPTPIAPAVLKAILGFDPDDKTNIGLDEIRKNEARKSRAKRH